MEILTETIERAGGVSALARYLGIKPNTISNWQTRGVPRAYTLLFELMRDTGSGVYRGHAPNIVTNVTEIKV